MSRRPFPSCPPGDAGHRVQEDFGEFLNVRQACFMKIIKTCHAALFSAHFPFEDGVADRKITDYQGSIGRVVDKILNVWILRQAA